MVVVVVIVAVDKARPSVEGGRVEKSSVTIKQTRVGWYRSFGSGIGNRKGLQH